MQSDSDFTEDFKSKSLKPQSVDKSGFSLDANELVKAIDDQISEELVSKDLTVSDEQIKARVLPSFDDGGDVKMSMAFAPTLPIYAFKSKRSDSLKSIEESDVYQAEA